MAFKARLAGVDIIPDVVVLVVHAALAVVVAMDTAEDAVIGRLIVAATSVAGGCAPGPFASMCSRRDGKIRAMIESGRSPRIRRVTLGTRGWKDIDVDRVGSLDEIVLVTSETFDRCAGKSSRMTFGAFGFDDSMSARQWKTSGGVVESGGPPACLCRVAGLTIGRKTALHMVGLSGVVEIREVATHALARSPGIVLLDVAIGARGAPVGSVKRKSKQGVIDGRGSPGQGGVTILTLGIQAGLRMSGICSACVFLRMTHDAFRRKSGEFILFLLGMTAPAVGRCMFTGQGKPRRRVLL